MSTILFNQIIFGPIKSRRLGISLGVNLLPAFGKWCSFDCIYCECGWNKDGKEDKKLPCAEDVILALEDRLQLMKAEGELPDTITFSGNGEPTMHPDFESIINNTLDLRQKYAPNAKVSVLTNGSRISIESVKRALLKVDNAIIKIDSCDESLIKLIDRPQYEYSLKKIVEGLEPFAEKFVLQTMFLKGKIDGNLVDTSTEELANGWRDLVRIVKPREIMIYTIDRETPLEGLEKVSIERMQEIAKPLIKEGFTVKISG
ncbi:hypothetical protein SDC9_84253 [bioreactor metagenome]|uniref:Radical SAM core domain-containing protein n=1 Tax=bioreactor metagenome TaxID=1076179 RepID=A0A644Z9R3_9ZZZZ